MIEERGHLSGIRGIRGRCVCAVPSFNQESRQKSALCLWAFFMRRNGSVIIVGRRDLEDLAEFIKFMLPSIFLS